jgi:hypothetical protein
VSRGNEIVTVFYFCARDGAHVLKDDEGVDLPDVAAARAYATEVARDIMRGDEPRKRSWVLEIFDAEGTIVAVLPFGAVDPTLGHFDEIMSAG